MVLGRDQLKKLKKASPINNAVKQVTNKKKKEEEMKKKGK